MRKILLIEDEENIRKIVAYDLSKAGYEVDEAEDGEIGLQKGLQNIYDLIVIDWMLPKVEGVDIVKELRNKNVESILFMLTAKDEEQDILACFEAGVDDYVCKPFSPKQLMARIQAHLKRLKKKEFKKTFANIQLDEKKRLVYVDEKILEVTKKEYELLEYYILNSNIVLSRDKILNDLWGFDYDGDTRIVDVHTFKLRSKLKSSKAIIKSSRGVGYILEEQDD